MSGAATTAELAAALAAGRSPAEVAVMTAKLRALTARQRAERICPTPLDLACALEPATVRTPALELIASRLSAAVTEPRSRLVVSLGPQQGKTTITSIFGALWALVQDPERRVIVASYALDLARTDSRRVRNLIEQQGSRAVDPATGQPMPDRLGITLARDHHAAADWALLGHQGGMYAVGVSGGLTGKPCDLLIIDDAHKDRDEADSEAMRARVWSWWTEVARTRLAPTASVIVIGTRWHPEDLTGRLLADQPDRWESVNIPALPESGIPDALDREPGEWLVSARGTTPQDWEDTRRDVGERGWYALYQGVPAPPTGGIFQREWIEQHRVREAPPLGRIEVGVDPADTGTGDEAGILVAGRAADGHLYVLADLSGRLSRAQWARTACLGVVRYDAVTLVSERTLGMQTAAQEAWALIRRQATALRAAAGEADPVAAALEALVAAGDDVAADRAQLAELAPLVEDVLSRPSARPCQVVVVTPKQAKHVRAENVTVHYETGRCHHVGTLGQLEYEQTSWLPGQPSPNRLDTLAHLLTHLHGSSAPMTMQRPSSGRQIPTSTAGAVNGRGRVVAFQSSSVGRRRTR